MRIAIVYASLSGNTEEVAQALYETLSPRMDVDLLPVRQINADTCLDHDHVFFGSYTWGDGKLPAEMRKALRFLLKDSDHPFTSASVFGTGDKQFVKYCRAVDEIAHHLKVHGRHLSAPSLKIEQSPRNRLPDVHRFADASVAFMEPANRIRERRSILCQHV